MKIAIMNGAGAFGRVAATYFADIYGPFNLQVMCTLVTAGTIWAVLGMSVKFCSTHPFYLLTFSRQT
jgi:hypothetical protein